MKPATYFTALVAVVSILATTPGILAKGEEGGIELVFHSQSLFYPLEEKDFSFELSGKLPAAGADKRDWRGSLKSDGAVVGVGGLMFYAATWRVSAPEGLKGAVLTMKGPENAMFQIRDRKTGGGIGAPGKRCDLGDIEGIQPERSVSIYCAARVEVKVVDEVDEVIEDPYLSGMTVGKVARNVPMTAVATKPGVFASEQITARVSVVVTKEGYEPYRLIVDCGSPRAKHARRVALKKLPLAVEGIEGGTEGEAGGAAKVIIRRGREFVKAEDEKLAWGKGYPVRLAVRMDPPREKFRMGDIIARTFLIQNVSDRTVEFDSRASLGYFSADFKRVVPGREAERGDGEIFDADEGVFQQMTNGPRDENMIRHVLEPGEIAEVPFSPIRIGEGASPGPPGHVIYVEPGDYILMSYQLKPYWLSEVTVPQDADWQGTVRAGNIYMRVSE